MASSDATPVPIKNQAFRLGFEARKSDGSLNTGGTGMDSEVSKDQGTFTDCTNEATEIASSSGCYYLDLTSTEMNADMVIVKCTFTNTNALPVTKFLYPSSLDTDAWADDLRNAELIGSGTAQAGASGTITLQASGSSSLDSFYNEARIRIVSGTGADQSRRITGYVGSTKVATVDHNWATGATPDNTSVYEIIPDSD